METRPNCRNCHSEHVIKNGSAYGIKRYKRKACGSSFSTQPKKYPDEIKAKAIELYLNNTGIRKIGRFLNISPPLVLKWIRSKAQQLAKAARQQAQELEQTQHLPETIEMDEIYTFVKKNHSGCRYGLLILGNEARLLPFVSKTKGLRAR